MLLNEFMKERLKRLDEWASKQPKRSLEEALADYDRLEKLARQADLKYKDQNQI